ncbi:MAG: ABC transporter ATP-binding protein [Sciscionella sp.]
MAVIEVSDLHKHYGTRVAVDEVSFTVADGEIFGILGPNGAGKTTTVECVAGLRTPDRGRVRVLGLDPRHDRQELRQLLGVQLQESELPDKLTVAEVLDLYGSFYRSSVERSALLDLLGLTGQRKIRYRKLSGGQKQRLSIALALIGRPKIAILDELTTGLDPQARRDTWDMVREIRDHGVTILLVTHFMEEAERLCDRVALINVGRVVAIGTPTGLADRPGTEQRIRFHTTASLPDRLLARLPAVTDVARTGNEVTVTGSDNVLAEVVGALAREGVSAEGLRVQRASLEDAFVALTGQDLQRSV